jgi:hypothetical protein
MFHVFAQRAIVGRGPPGDPLPPPALVRLAAPAADVAVPRLTKTAPTITAPAMIAAATPPATFARGDQPRDLVALVAAACWCAAAPTGNGGGQDALATRGGGGQAVVDLGDAGWVPAVSEAASSSVSSPLVAATGDASRSRAPQCLQNVGSPVRSSPQRGQTFGRTEPQSTQKFAPAVSQSHSEQWRPIIRG